MTKAKARPYADYYHDDPVTPVVKRRNIGALTSSAMLLVAGLFLSNTLAANISLSSGAGVEFGQGVSITTACSGSQALTVTPYSTFVNSSGAGSYYFSSVKVYGIPTSCYGVDFTINAYGETSTTPLAIFNTNATNATISNNSGTFQLADGSSNGASISSGSGTFTITFTNPVATAGSVARLTLQSSSSTALTCAQGGLCSVGELGPGGGRVFFYASSGFNCGATHSSTGSPTGGLCKYLEVAPSGWNTGSDPTKPWAVSANQSSDISGITNDATAYNNILGVGLGYKNSSLIVTLNGMYNASTNNYAAGAARAYSGGTKSDWYLPTLAELNLLCQWAHGVAPSVGTACTGGSINSSIYGANSAGFAANGYWSSSELSTTNAWAVAFGSPFQGDGGKNLAISVRPIRAF